MAQVLGAEEEAQGFHKMTHAMADCYCDDWTFAQDVDGTNTPAERKRKQQLMYEVAQILLSQVQPGIIALLHMPQRGFREGLLEALEFFLQGLHSMGYKCVTLTELQTIAASAGKEEERRRVGPGNEA